MWGREPSHAEGLIGETLLEALTGALGQPTLLESQGWRQYRWSVKRPGRPALNVYLTIDPRGGHFAANVLIGDPCRCDDTLRQVSVRCREQIAPLVEEINERLATG
jgi:hypothetical protein